MQETNSRRAARRGIRWHLFQVQLVGLVPIGLFAAALLYLHGNVQEHEREQSQVQTVRLLAAAVDNALDSTIERLSIFARLWSSKSVDEAALYAQAKDAVAATADWSNLFAFASDGRAVFRTDVPFGTPLPPTLHADIWRPAFEERRPVVSDVFRAVRRDANVVSVAVPVMQGDAVSHVLIANIDLRWYDELLAKQGLPAGAVAALMDRNFKFVARSSEGDLRRGKDPSPALVAQMKVRREGIGRFTNLNGTPVYTAWTLTRHGWGVGLATPSAPVEDAFWSHLLLFGFLWAAAVAAGMLYAIGKARTVAAALESLEDQAQHFATGRRISDLPDSGVEEVDRALGALEKASELLQSATKERDRSLETEREARAAAEAANHAKDEFLAMLGHELRNPSAAIANAASIVKNRCCTPEQLDFAAGVIERQSAHLKRLLDDLLDVGRAITGKIVLDTAPLELAACAERVVRTLETAGLLAERSVELETEPVWIEGDATRIEQVLANLLSNAARYSSVNGRIRVRVSREGRDAVVEVADDGRGIRSADLPRLFELFFQAKSADRGTAGGLGIGLTLAQRIARLHGGEVTAHSDGPGRGASFTLRLPALAAGAEGTRGAARSSCADTVLIVEDNDDTRESLRIALELRGHRVFAAPDAAGALAIMREQRPVIAVLDIGLPDTDGYELARKLRSEFGDELVLVALTGYGTPRERLKAAQAGFDEHVSKPIDVDELRRLLEKLSRSRRAVA
ncbi:MAG TPA: ATP-binding protein [Gammaproteobacteria bacterium]|nr:ATP-binding protein [Gammaproteobacteria bacterium]